MKYNYILLAILSCIFILFISYKLCDIRPGKLSKRQFFCNYPISSILFFILIVLYFILKK